LPDTGPDCYVSGWMNLWQRRKETFTDSGILGVETNQHVA